MRSMLLCAAVCCLLIPCPLLAQDAEVGAAPMSRTMRVVRDSVAALREARELEGVGVAVVQGDSHWSEGFGQASVTDAIPFTAHTAIPLHELAKLFTAVAVMQLVEQDKVDLDASFGRYVPGFEPYLGSVAAGDFSVRQLLSHHSGLPSRWGPGFLVSPDGETPPPDWEDGWRQVLEADRELALVSEPGQVYGYSYLGYALLGLLVEAVSGQEYSAYVRDHILRPLGMERTGFGAAPRDGAAVSSAFREGSEAGQPLFRDLPANGLVSSPADMALFMRALVSGGGPLLAPESLRRMFSVQNAGVARDANFRIGLGFFLSPATGGPLRDLASISQASDVGRSQSYFVALPQQGLAVLLVSNAETSTLAVRDAADAILLDMLAASTGQVPSAYQARAAVSPAARRGEALEGWYEGVGGLYEVVMRGDTIRLRVPQFPMLNIELLAREEGWYGIRMRLFGLLSLRLFSFVEEFERSLQMRVLEFDGRPHLYWYWRDVAGVSLARLAPPDGGAPAAAWRERAGQYRAVARPEREVSLWWDDDSGHFLFGRKPGFMRMSREPAILFCVAGAGELRRCAQGLEPPGYSNVLRALDDGRLLDAYGHYYEPVP